MKEEKKLFFFSFTLSIIRTTTLNQGSGLQKDLPSSSWWRGDVKLKLGGSS